MDDDRRSVCGEKVLLEIPQVLGLLRCPLSQFDDRAAQCRRQRRSVGCRVHYRHLMLLDQVDHVPRTGTGTITVGKLREPLEQLALQSVHRQMHNEPAFELRTGVIGNLEVSILPLQLLEPLQANFLSLFSPYKRVEPTVGQLANEIAEEFDEV